MNSPTFNQIHELFGPGLRSDFAPGSRSFVGVRRYDRVRLDQLIYRVRSLMRLHRERARVYNRKIHTVIAIDDRFHIAHQRRIPSEIYLQTIREFEDIAVSLAHVRSKGIGSEVGFCGVGKEAPWHIVAVVRLDQRNTHALASARNLKRSLAA